MPSTKTPLRYPGGKSKLYDTVRNILARNNLIGGTYVEPFAGGCGLALKLLFNGDVSRIVINDYDPAIYAFWYCVLNLTEEFCEKIQNTAVNLAVWDEQKFIYNSIMHNNYLEYGFATFFLNRTNMSGVIMGGAIGGRSQKGKYKIDARFNKTKLIEQIKKIAEKRQNIILTNMDVCDFLNSDILRYRHKVFINFDPPYVEKGSQLYKNSFTQQDHARLSKLIFKCRHKWIVTYDVCDLVKTLYKFYHIDYIDINYTIGKNVQAQEYIIYDNNLNRD